MVTGVHDCTTNQHSVRLESLIGGLHICDLIGQFSGSHTRDLISQFTHTHTHTHILPTLTPTQTILLQNMYQNPNNQTQNPGVQPGEITEYY